MSEHSLTPLRTQFRSFWKWKVGILTDNCLTQWKLQYSTLSQITTAAALSQIREDGQEHFVDAVWRVFQPQVAAQQLNLQRPFQSEAVLRVRERSDTVKTIVDVQSTGCRRAASFSGLHHTRNNARCPLDLPSIN